MKSLTASVFSCSPPFIGGVFFDCRLNDLNDFTDEDYYVAGNSNSIKLFLRVYIEPCTELVSVLFHALCIV
jgi:hypothetical protein